MTKILDGKAVAAQIRAEIKEEIIQRSRPIRAVCASVAGSKAPCLAVVLCSTDPASELYVAKKREACAEVGIISYLIRPFEGGIENWHDPQGHLLSTIKYLNDDQSVDGILVQLPLPKINETGPFRRTLEPHAVFDVIHPKKDVDVFNPENVGLLLQGRPRFVPCTPAGIQELLTRHGIEIEGKRVCIINRSDIVGKPLSALLIQNNKQANATVTLCHDHTPSERLREVCLASDIIVVAVGKPKFLTRDFVPKGAVVVDVGINRTEGSNKIVGDVDYEGVFGLPEWISRVPGGCGPVTVACLLKNTLLAQKLR